MLPVDLVGGLAGDLSDLAGASLQFGQGRDRRFPFRDSCREASFLLLGQVLGLVRKSTDLGLQGLDLCADLN